MSRHLATTAVSPAAQPQPPAGTTARHPRARYRITRQLGSGGMGVVYEARDSGDQVVALKFDATRPARTTARLERLSREAAAMARVSSPHVCRSFGVETHRGQPCLVMERLDGTDLLKCLRHRRLNTREALDIATQVARALDATHRAGLVHCDVKPANVFITTTGVVKLLDWGLAVPAGTPEGMVLGTANYVAPERILRRPNTPQGDLFSLGAVLYEMLCGEPPFAGSTPAETIFNILDAVPAPLQALAPACPRALVGIVHRLLDKDSTRRPPSAASLERALREVRDADTSRRRTRTRNARGSHSLVA